MVRCILACPKSRPPDPNISERAVWPDADDAGLAHSFAHQALQLTLEPFTDGFGGCVRRTQAGGWSTLARFPIHGRDQGHSACSSPSRPSSCRAMPTPRSSPGPALRKFIMKATKGPRSRERGKVRDSASPHRLTVLQPCSFAAPLLRNSPHRFQS